MWEQIRANQRKSFLLFGGLALCLAALGYAVGAAVAPPDGGIIGVLIAVIIWLVMAMISLFGGQSIFLDITGAREISRDIHPQLFNIVEEMKIAANLPAMPRLFIIPERAPNAFATGVDPQNSAIAVTAGLLARLNRDELQGVIAHEMSHILNRDIQFMTLSGILLGTVTLISEVFLRGFRGVFASSGSSRRYGGGRGGGQAQVIVILVAVIFAILAPILARLFYFAISRKREYLADASAARLTRYPEGLASALEKISSSKVFLNGANSITAPMFIVNPFTGQGMEFASLLSTHPPAEERIRILRGMSGGASYGNYQAAYKVVKGLKESIIPPSGLAQKDAVPIRAPQPGTLQPQEQREILRQIGDLTRAASGFLFIPCACGLRVKLPPEFNGSAMNCPRCARTLSVPTAEMATMGAALDSLKTVSAQPTPAVSDEPQTYVRRSRQWETVSCACGQAMQVSPLFAGTHMRCQKCGRGIQIISSGF